MSYGWTVNNMLRGDQGPGHFPEDAACRAIYLGGTAESIPAHGAAGICYAAGRVRRSGIGGVWRVPVSA